MIVEELIELLSKLPKGDIILADIGQEEEAEIIDVLVGSGTIKGFSFLKIEPYDE